MHRKHKTVILGRQKAVNIDTGATLKGKSTNSSLNIFLDQLNVLQIGSGKDNDLMLNDPTISKKHCILLRNEHNSYSILDLDSKNGSFVNGVSVIKELELQNGDQIRLGNLEFIYHCGGSKLDKSISDFISKPKHNYRISKRFKKMTFSVASLSIIAFALSVFLLLALFI